MACVRGGSAAVMRRLRNLPDMQATYAVPHDHRLYGHGHHLRVEQTKAVARWLAEWKGCVSAADLSCGNGEVLTDLGRVGVTQRHYGDFAPGYDYHGPIEQTIEEIPNVDLFICCETLEHLDKPLHTLSRIRDKARYMILSTPVENWKDANGEHLWAWSQRGVEHLTSSTGWGILHFTLSDTRPLDGIYTYGIWALEAV